MKGSRQLKRITFGKGTIVIANKRKMELMPGSIRPIRKGSESSLHQLNLIFQTNISPQTSNTAELIRAVAIRLGEAHSSAIFMATGLSDQKKTARSINIFARESVKDFFEDTDWLNAQDFPCSKMFAEELKTSFELHWKLSRNKND